MRIAIDPPVLAYNAFVGSFSKAVSAATGGTVAAFSDSLFDVLKTDIVILHWPNDFMGLTSRRKALWKLAKINLAQRFGLKLVWVAHNVAPHEGAGRHNIVPDRFFASLDGIIYLSSASRDIVRERYKIAARTIEYVTVHGCYGDPGAATPIALPPAHLPVRIANVGQIRPYKNVDELVQAALSVPDGAMHLTLSGFAPDQDFAQSLRNRVEEQAGLARDVTLDLRSEPLSEAEVERLIDQSHGVALPYRNILNSGSAIFALSRARPVLVPGMGSMPELREMVGAEWVMLYEGDIDGKILDDFSRFIRETKRPPRPDLSSLSWPRVTDDLRQFFGQLGVGAAKADLHPR